MEWEPFYAASSEFGFDVRRNRPPGHIPKKSNIKQQIRKENSIGPTMNVLTN